MSASTSGNATAGATAKLLDGDDTSPSVAVITNEDATNGIRVGYTSVSVDSTHGLLVKAGATVTLPLDAGEDVYFAAAASTPAVSWARARNLLRSG